MKATDLESIANKKGFTYLKMYKIICLEKEENTR